MRPGQGSCSCGMDLSGVTFGCEDCTARWPQRVAGYLEETARELALWREGHIRAEQYFDQVNEPDEAWNARREARASGAAGYRAVLRAELLKAGLIS